MKQAPIILLLVFGLILVTARPHFQPYRNLPLFDHKGGLLSREERRGLIEPIPMERIESAQLEDGSTFSFHCKGTYSPRAENFDFEYSIEGVACTPTSLTLFVSDTDFLAAWTEGTLLSIGDFWGCWDPLSLNGRFRELTSDPDITGKKNDQGFVIVTMSTKMVSVSDIFPTFSLQVESKKSSPESPNSKRELYNYENDFENDINFNYNPMSSDISLYSSPNVQVTCTTCYASMGINFSFSVSYSLDNLDALSFTVNGNLNSAAEISANFEGEISFSYPLINETFIYGIKVTVLDFAFEIGFFAGMNATGSLSFPSPLTFSAGANIAGPFAFGITYPSSTDTFQISGSNGVLFTPNFNFPSSASSTLKFGLEPYIKLVIPFLYSNITGSLQPYLQATLSYPGPCASDSFSYSTYYGFDFEVDFTGATFEVIYDGEIRIGPYVLLEPETYSEILIPLTAFSCEACSSCVNLGPTSPPLTQYTGLLGQYEYNGNSFSTFSLPSLQTYIFALYPFDSAFATVSTYCSGETTIIGQVSGLNSITIPASSLPCLTLTVTLIGSNSVLILLPQVRCYRGTVCSFQLGPGVFSYLSLQSTWHWTSVSLELWTASSDVVAFGSDFSYTNMSSISFNSSNPLTENNYYIQILSETGSAEVIATVKSQENCLSGTEAVFFLDPYESTFLTMYCSVSGEGVAFLTLDQISITNGITVDIPEAEVQDLSSTYASFTFPCLEPTNLEVSALSQTEEGSGTLSYYVQRTLTLGATVEGSLQLGEFMYYIIDIPSLQNVSIALSTISGNANLYISNSPNSYPTLYFYSASSTNQYLSTDSLNVLVSQLIVGVYASAQNSSYVLSVSTVSLPTQAPTEVQTSNNIGQNSSGVILGISLTALFLGIFFALATHF